MIRGGGGVIKESSKLCAKMTCWSVVLSLAAVAAAVAFCFGGRKRKSLKVRKKAAS